MTDEHMQQLLEQQKTIMEKLSRSKEKDKWDKLAILSTFLSSIVIGVVGIYFTTTFKAREITTADAQVRIAKDNAEAQVRTAEAQVRTADAQLAQQFIADLTGQNENAKKGALLILSTLRNKELAFKLGAFYASEGTIEALELLLKSGEGEDKTLLKDALVDALFTRTETNYVRDQNYDQMLSDCKRILELKSPDELRTKNGGYFLPDYYRWRAYAHCELQQYDPADRDFDESLKLMPNYDRLHVTIGQCYLERKNHDEARKHFDLAIGIDDNPSAYGYRGTFFLRIGKIDEAISDYKHYVKAYPGDYKGFYALANAYEKKQQRPEYCASLETAQNLVHRQTVLAVDERDVVDIDERMMGCSSSKRKADKTQPAGQ